MAAIRGSPAPLPTDRLRDFWSTYGSFSEAATTYAFFAPSEEVHCAARLISSWVHRPVPFERKRWFAIYLAPHSPMSESISDRLARFTQDLENIPESDAPPLLDHFTQLLDLWVERQGPAKKEPDTLPEKKTEGLRPH